MCSVPILCNIPEVPLLFCYSMNLKSIILNLCRCCKYVRDGVYVLGNNDNNLFSLLDIDTLTTYIVFPSVLSFRKCRNLSFIGDSAV